MASSGKSRQALPPERDLASLLAAIGRGEEPALAAFYDATSRWVHGFVHRVVDDAALAEEVTLDVYLQVWRRAGTYDPGRGSPSSWLLTLVRSRAIDCLRAVRVARRHEESLRDGFEAAAIAPDPASTSELEERRQAVLEAVQRLPPEQRRAIDLAFFHGLTHVEIAERLGNPVGTVKTRIRLGMMRLRDSLKAIEDGS